jgi:DNA-binding IclR family transcriptional regulator
MERSPLHPPGEKGKASLAPPLSPASQTLIRGLDVLELVASGPLALSALATRLGLARSTAHRLAAALLERRYLTLVPKQGYGLGPKLLELGAQAQEQTGLVRVARPYLDRLAAETADTAYLSQIEAGSVLVLAWVPGHRRLLSSLRVGERSGITRQASGWALLLDATEEDWREQFALDCGSAASPAAFLDMQRRFDALGYAFDPVDAADNVRSVAAPIRDAQGEIVAAIGLSTAAQYLNDVRLAALGHAVCRVAAEIGHELGGPAPEAVRLRSSPNGKSQEECLVCK